MSEYKFRGKTKDGEWVYGYLLEWNNKTYILQIPRLASTKNMLEWMVEVIKETIGQYSDYKDHKEKELFKGDIVQFYNDVEYILHPGIAVVEFDLGAFGLKHNKYGFEFFGNMDIDDMYIRKIGNIYDNSKLLEGDKN